MTKKTTLNNKILRSGVDINKTVDAAIFQMKAGNIIQAGVGGTKAATITHRKSWVRRMISNLIRRLLPVLRPALCRLREYFNAPTADRLSEINRRLEKIEASLQGSELTSRLEQMASYLEQIETYGLAAARRTAVNLGDGRIMVRSSVGYVMCSARDPVLVACLLDTGELEIGTRLLIERIVRPGMTFIDIGANIGLHTLAAARAMRGVGKVVAFEPFGPTRSLLEESIFINGFSGLVEIHEAAVSSRSGVGQLHLGKSSGHHSLYPLAAGVSAGHKVVDVVLLRLADVVPLSERIDLIKIDVEGAELEVLEGATPFIENNPDIALIVEFGSSHLARTGSSVAEWFGAFSSLGLIYKAIDPFTGALNILTSEQLTELESTNLLFARPDSSVWVRACATS